MSLNLETIDWCVKTCPKCGQTLYRGITLWFHRLSPIGQLCDYKESLDGTQVKELTNG